MSETDSPTHGAPNRNRHAIDLLVNVPRDRPQQARAMRDAAAEIDRLQTELIEERQRFAEHLAAWTANSHHHAAQNAQLADELQRWKFEAGRLHDDLRITRLKLQCHVEANQRQARRIDELQKAAAK